MASPKSNRGSRKRRKPGMGRSAGASSSATARPGAPRNTRKEMKAERHVLADRQKQRQESMLGPYGDPPPSPFGWPVSEFMILVGAVGVVVGLVSSAPAALAVGIIVCTLGVAEFSLREHLSGYRSHASLLAGIAAIAVGVALIALFGGSLRRSVLLGVVAVVFFVIFRLLRRRFRVARQARIARPPAP